MVPTPPPPQTIWFTNNIDELEGVYELRTFVWTTRFLCVAFLLTLRSKLTCHAIEGLSGDGGGQPDFAVSCFCFNSLPNFGFGNFTSRAPPCRNRALSCPNLLFSNEAEHFSGRHNVCQPTFSRCTAAQNRFLTASSLLERTGCVDRGFAPSAHACWQLTV